MCSARGRSQTAGLPAEMRGFGQCQNCERVSATGELVDKGGRSVMRVCRTCAKTILNRVKVNRKKKPKGMKLVLSRMNIRSKVELSMVLESLKGRGYKEVKGWPHSSSSTYVLRKYATGLWEIMFYEPIET